MRNSYFDPRPLRVVLIFMAHVMILGLFVYHDYAQAEDYKKRNPQQVQVANPAVPKIYTFKCLRCGLVQQSTMAFPPKCLKDGLPTTPVR